MDFPGARRAVQQHLDGLYEDAREHPTVLAYGYDTGDAWAPLIDWDGVAGVYVYLVDKSSGGLKSLSFPEFLDMPDPVQVGDWPVESRLRIVTSRTWELLNHPGHPNQKIHGRGGVRDALKKARTDDEVSDAAEAEAKRITGRDIKFDFAGSDVQIAKEHAEGVLRGLERYPDAPVTKVYQGGNVVAETRGYMAHTDPTTGTITFTDHAQRGGPDVYRETLADFQAAGHVATGTPMGVAMHEFGHIVAEHGGSSPRVAAKIAGMAQKAGQTEADFLSDHVSSYATEDQYEAAAEGFADVMHNGVSGASPASVEIAAVVDAGYLAASGRIRNAISSSRLSTLVARTRLRNHPGHPNQKVHGGRGGGVLHESDEALRGAYEYTDGPTGMSTSVRRIIRTDKTIFVSIDIHDRSGVKVGESLRTINTAKSDTVQHDMLTLEPPAQGQGFATRFNAHAEGEYLAHGITKIELRANVDVGGYAWARAGYRFKTGRDRARIVKHATDVATRHFDPEVRAQVAKVAANPNASPIEFAMIGHTPGATTWPGKEIMLGTTWDGVKDL